jgi:PKD repeat protein
VDAAKNEEMPHNVVSGIKIDRTMPTVIIETPETGIIPKGDVKVSGTVYESSSGSGVNKVEVWFQGGAIPENEITLSPSKDYFEWHFTAQSAKTYTMSTQGYQNNIRVLATQYEIEVRAYDNAGNMGNAYVTVKCSVSLSYQLDKDVSQSYPVNEPITFYESTSGGTEAYSYYWTFDDGTTSTEQNPTHTYTSPGS